MNFSLKIDISKMNIEGNLRPDSPRRGQNRPSFGEVSLRVWEIIKETAVDYYQRFVRGRVKYTLQDFQETSPAKGEKELTFPSPQLLDFVVCPPGEGEKIPERNPPTSGVVEISEDQPRIRWALEQALELDDKFSAEEDFFVSKESPGSDTRYHVIDLQGWEMVIFVANTPDSATYIVPREGWEDLAQKDRTELRTMASEWTKFLKCPKGVPPVRVKRIRNSWKKGAGGRQFDTEEIWKGKLDRALSSDSTNIKPLRINFNSVPLPEKLDLARKALALHGFTDRVSLEMAYTNPFADLEFEGFGKGYAFCFVLLGRKVEGITEAVLSELADALGFPTRHSPELMAEYKSALASAGYTDRFLLETAVAKTVGAAIFGKFGNGKTFYRYVTGDTSEMRILEERHLKIFADILFSEIPRQVMARKLLADAGFPDRESLLIAGPKKFADTVFPGNQKGAAFYHWFLEKTSKGIERREQLEEIANEAGLLKISQSRFQEFLLVNGYADRKSLLGVTGEVFEAQTFGPFGKGIAFYRFVTGKTVKHIHAAQLEEIAENVGYPAMEEVDPLVECRKTLVEKGIVTREDLAKARVHDLRQTPGEAFFTHVLGFPGRVTRERILAAAEKLFPGQEEVPASR